MDESIYNLVPREYVAPVKPAMHRSSHNPTAPLTGSTFGCKGTSRLLGAGTMVKKEGALFGPRPKPMDENAPTYLVKKTVDNSTAGKSSFSYDKSTKKPPVVPQSEHPVMGIRTTKNFITANAVEAILAGKLYHIFAHVKFAC